MGGPLALDDHHSMEGHNNQPKDGGSDGLCGGNSKLGNKGGAGHYPIVWAVKFSNGKIKIER